MSTNNESSLYNMFKDLGLVISISDGIVGVKGQTTLQMVK